MKRKVSEAFNVYKWMQKRKSQEDEYMVLQKQEVVEMRHLFRDADMNPWNPEWVLERPSPPLRPVLQVEILKCLIQHPSLIQWNQITCYHSHYICWENELYLRMKLKTDKVLKLPKENSRMYAIRKKGQIRETPGINRHGQIRKSFRHPGKNRKILADWQIQLVPPSRHLFQIPENSFFENAIWPLSLNNPDIIANQHFAMMVLIMSVVMSLTIIQEEQNQ